MISSYINEGLALGSFKIKVTKTKVKKLRVTRKMRGSKQEKMKSRDRRNCWLQQRCGCCCSQPAYKPLLAQCLCDTNSCSCSSWNSCAEHIDDGLKDLRWARDGWMEERIKSAAKKVTIFNIKYRYRVYLSLLGSNLPIPWELQRQMVSCSWTLRGRWAFSCLNLFYTVDHC